MANYEQVARRAAARYGLNPNVFVRQIRAESGFNPRVVSSAGARGIAQIMPATARGWGVNPDDPNAALNAAAKNMASYVRKYGSYRNALVAYNAGPGRVGKPLYSETANYIARILPNGEPTGGLGPGRPGARTQTAPRGGARPPVATAGGSDLQAQARRQAAAEWLLSSSKSTSVLANRVAAAESQVPASTTPTPAAPRVASRRSVAPASASTSASGVANFEGTKVAAWIAPILKYARAHGWKGTLNNGFRSYAEQTKIYNSGIRPAAKPGTSNHEGSEWPRGAIDVNSGAAELARILRRSPYANKLVWAGAKDPPHFSHPHNGSY